MDWYGTAVGKNGAAVQSGGYPDWRNNSNIRRRWHHRRGFRGKRRIPHHQHSIEPIGRSRLLTIKSSLSSTSLPPMRCRLLHTLYPSTHGILAISIITPFISAALFLDQPNISMANDMIFSNTAITVEKLAKVINKKKRQPHMGLELHHPWSCKDL